MGSNRINKDFLGTINICPHIRLNHIEKVGLGNGEYTEYIFIYCNECKKEFKIPIEIN